MKSFEAEHSKRVGFLIERSFRVTKLAFIQLFQKFNLPITPDQYILLDLLHEKKSCSQRELTGLSFKDAPNVSRIIEIMVQKGWVVRTSLADDRRVTMLSLSDKGQEFWEKCRLPVENLREQTWAGLSESEYDQFCRLMDKIYENLVAYHPNDMS